MKKSSSDYYSKCRFYPNCRRGIACKYAHGDEEMENPVLVDKRLAECEEAEKTRKVTCVHCKKEKFASEPMCFHDTIISDGQLLVLCAKCGMFDTKIFAPDHVCDFNVPLLEDSDIDECQQEFLIALSFKHPHYVQIFGKYAESNILKLFNKYKNIYTVVIENDDRITWHRFRGLSDVEFDLME